MRILLTNDDGLFTNGLLHLEEAVQHLGEVWCIAPDRERSATSQALSIRETLHVREIRPRKYTVNGYPTDCVNIALFTGEFPEFDLVISGINHGPNLGDDIHYSGTVGAARHAALHSRKAVAASCPIRDHKGDFRRVAAWIAGWIQDNVDRLENRIVYNINYPLEKVGLSLDSEYPRHEFTSQGKRLYKDSYELLEEGHDGRIYKLRETDLGYIEESGTDFSAMERGVVSITPISTDTTAARFNLTAK